MGNGYQKVTEPLQKALDEALDSAINEANNDEAIIALLESNADPMSISDKYYKNKPILYFAATTRNFDLFKIIYKYANNPNNLELLKYVISHIYHSADIRYKLHPYGKKILLIYNYISEIDQQLLQPPNDLELIKHITFIFSESEDYYRNHGKSPYSSVLIDLCCSIIQKNKTIMDDVKIREYLMEAACRYDDINLLKKFTDNGYDCCFRNGTCLVAATKYNSTSVAKYLIDLSILNTPEIPLAEILKQAAKHNNSELITLITSITQGITQEITQEVNSVKN